LEFSETMPPNSAGASAFNATISSQLATVVIYPLELAKTRFQASSAKSEVKYKSILDAFQHILREEGFFGLYTGIQGELIQQALMQGVFYYFYSYFKCLAANRKRGESTDTYEIRCKIQTEDGDICDQLKVIISSNSQAIENIMVDNEGQELSFDLVVNDSDMNTVKGLFGETWKRKIESQLNGLQVGEINVNEKTECTFFESTASGVAAGCITVVIMLPVSSVLTRMQTRSKSSPDANFGLMGTFQHLANTNGASSLWRGLVPGIILTVNPTIVNVFYDKARAHLLSKRRNGQALTATEAFFLACLAKFVATLFTFPYIISKTRMMLVDDKTGRPLYRNTTHVVRTILATEGPAGLYRGLLTQSFKSVIQMGLLLMFKEKVPIYMSKLRKHLAQMS